MANRQMILGLKMASKVFTLFVVWNLVTLYVPFFEINPRIGLSTNIGKEALPKGRISEQKETVYCFYQKPESLDIFL